MKAKSSLAISPLLAGVIGMTLLLPATYFFITLLVRIFFGSTTLYYAIAPSFFQSPFGFFSFHLVQAIIYGPLVAVIINLLSSVGFRFLREDKRWGFKVYFRGHWLNMAIAMQSGLLFMTLVAYTLIQHWRY